MFSWIMSYSVLRNAIFMELVQIIPLSYFRSKKNQTETKVVKFWKNIIILVMGIFYVYFFCHYRKFVLSIELASKKIFAKLWTLNSMYELYTNNYTISRVRVKDTGTQDAKSQLLNQIQIDKLHSSVADPVWSGSF